jgi:phosphonatase-like hydrolase
MIQLIVFDIAGTTVRDHDEVLYCFRKACRETGIQATDQRLNALMGVSKNEVFQILWREQLGDHALDVQVKAAASYGHFRVILEDYYHNIDVEPTEGCLDTFAWCRQNNIKIALNTGFYRAVTDIILDRISWKIGRDIDFVIASDEVQQGRPAPFMIQKAMQTLGIKSAEHVVKVGDTPVDIQEGRSAQCKYVISLTNGTHSRYELAGLWPDALLNHLGELPQWLEQKKGS